MSFMTEQFEKVARDGIITDTINKMKGQVSPAEAKVMVQLNIQANDALEAKRKEMIRRVERGENFTMEDFINSIHEVAKSTLDEMAAQYMKDGDWEAYGFTMWVKGSMAIR